MSNESNVVAYPFLGAACFCAVWIVDDQIAFDKELRNESELMKDVILEGIGLVSVEHFVTSRWTKLRNGQLGSRCFS